jgi:Skp family chaperone for outer membrane proteins
LVKINAMQNVSDGTQMLEQARLCDKTIQSIFNIIQQRYLDISLLENGMKNKKNGLALLNSHLGHLANDFRSKFDILRKNTSEYGDFMELFNVERSKSLLQGIKLPNSLASENKRFLMDLVQESGISKHFEQCKRYLLPLQRQSRAFTDEFNKSEIEMKQIGIEIQPHLKQPLDMENLIVSATLLVESSKMLVEQVRGLYSKMIGGDSTNHFIQIFNLDPITKISKNDDVLRSLLCKAQEISNKFTEETRVSFGTILALQNKIKGHVSKVQLYNNMHSETLEGPLTILRTVHYLPEQYGKSLSEIQRRQLLKTEVEKQILSMNTILKNVSDEENLIRKNFVETTKFVPQDLIPGLNERFPLFSVQVIPFDTKLPEVTKTEMDDGDWQHIKDDRDDKVAMFGKISLKDSGYFDKVDLSGGNQPMDDSLTVVAKDIFQNQPKPVTVALISPTISNSELERCKEELDDLKKEFTRLETDRQALATSLEEKTRELNDIAKQKEEEIARAQTSLKEQRDSLQDVQNLNEKKQKEVMDALSVVNQYKEQQNRFALEISNLKTENSKLSLVVSTLTKNETTFPTW